MRVRLSLLVLLPILLSSVGVPAFSQDMTRVDPDRTVEITAHGVCRRVSNRAQSPAMVPHRTAAEWAPSGAASFLSNLPPDMTAVACVSPEIALRTWSRPGPSGRRGQPLEIDGATEGLTFTSVGTGMAGSTVTLSGNRIFYTPSPDTWRLGYLAEATDTVPFAAIDTEGIPVAGTLTLRLVGYYDENAVRLVRYYAPGRNPSVEVGFIGELPGETGALNRMSTIYTTGAFNFDGKLHTFGLMSLQGILSHAVLIDTSPATMAAWSGDPVGDVNGDGTANTILDAQIDSVFRFVDQRVAEAVADLSPVRLTADRTPYGGAEDDFFLQISNLNAKIDPVFFYEAKGDLNYIGLIDSTDGNPGQKARTLLTPLRAGQGEAREITGSAAPGSLIRARLASTGVTREAVASAGGSYLIRFEPSDLPASAGTYPVTLTTFGPVTVTGTADPGSRVLLRVPESGATRRIDVDDTGTYEVVFSPEEVPRTETAFDIIVRTTAPVEVTGSGPAGAVIEAFVPETLATRRKVIGQDGSYRITFPVSELPEIDVPYQIVVRTLDAGVSTVSNELIVNGTAPAGSRVRAEIPLTGAERSVIVGPTGAYQITFPPSETPSGPGDYEALLSRVSPLEVTGTADPGALVRVTVPETGASLETVADGAGTYTLTLPISNLPETGAPYEVVTLARGESRITGTTIGAGRVTARIPATGATRTVSAGLDGRFSISFPPSDLPDTPDPFIAELTYLSYVEGAAPFTHSGTAEPGTFVRVTIPATGAVKNVTAGSDSRYTATFNPSELPATETPYQVRTLFRSAVRLSGVSETGGEVRAEVPSTGQVRSVQVAPGGAFAITLPPSILPDTQSNFSIILRFPNGETRTFTQKHQLSVSDVDPASSSALLLKHATSSFTVEPSVSILTVNASVPPSAGTDDVLTIAPDVDTLQITPSTSTLNITTPGNGLRLGQVFSRLETEMPTILQNQFAMAIHLLSPGVNAGSAPDLTRFRDRTATGFGAPVFSFYSGSDPASSGAQLLAGLDRDGAVRRLGEGGGFGGFIVPDPIIPYVVPYIWNNGQQFMRRSDGSIFFLPAERIRNGSQTYRFAYRILDGEDTTCTRLFCAPREIPNPPTLTGFTGIDATKGVNNETAVGFELARAPGYRVHSDVFADFYNQGALLLRDAYLLIPGAYEPTPP